MTDYRLDQMFAEDPDSEKRTLNKLRFELGSTQAEAVRRSLYKIT